MIISYYVKIQQLNDLTKINRFIYFTFKELYNNIKLIRCLAIVFFKNCAISRFNHGNKIVLGKNDKEHLIL